VVRRQAAALIEGPAPRAFARGWRLSFAYCPPFRFPPRPTAAAHSSRIPVPTRCHILGTLQLPLL
jgi:hypothetical protein